jgi:transcriptional regulator with XRE-family HTH domain
MSESRGKFGAFIRRERTRKEIGLREMAKMIGVSPTYLSKVERDEFAPPAEDKVKAIAKIIGCNPDDLLARAGRVPTDILDIIKRNPVELAWLLRTTADSGWTADHFARLAQEFQKMKDEIPDTTTSHPELTALMRTEVRLSADDFARLAQKLQKAKDE